jgi:hypothetical protein
MSGARHPAAGAGVGNLQNYSTGSSEQKKKKMLKPHQV